MVTRAPIVADALVSVDDQRIDAELLQGPTNGEPGPSAPDNGDGRIAIGEGARFGQPVAPVLGAKVSRRVGLRPAPEFFLVASELVQIRVQRPGAQAAVRVGDETQDAIGGAKSGFELEQGFNGFS